MHEKELGSDTMHATQSGEPPKPSSALSSSTSPAPDEFAVSGVGGTGDASTLGFADQTKSSRQYLLVYHLGLSGPSYS